MTEWISVEDGWPTSEEAVLVAFADPERPDEPASLGIGYYYSHMGWSRPNVTHWMPLPEPPEDNDD